LNGSPPAAELSRWHSPDHDGTTWASAFTLPAAACEVRGGAVSEPSARRRRGSFDGRPTAGRMLCQAGERSGDFRGGRLSTITVKDGTTIYYKDWGRGPVVTFSHGWPLSSDAWDGQMLFLMQNGFRVVAHDRRGHGRSSQASSGNDMDGYANDLAAVIEALDLTEATLVGHSTGGGEVARYIGRYGTKRVARAVLIAPL